MTEIRYLYLRQKRRGRGFPVIPEVTQTSNMAFDFHPSLFGLRNFGFRSLFKRSPLKRTRKEKINSLEHMDVDFDDDKVPS